MFIIYLISTAFCGTIIPEFYHTTEQIDQEVQNTLKICRMKASTKDHGEIYSITLRPMNGNTKNKAFVIFGEHAREMISVETGLHFLKKVCTEGLDLKLKMIINMNPGSRKYVEKGHYCLRENLNGVDLNRNYGFQWKYKEDHFQQDSSGSEPFSEIATQTVRDILLQFKPRTFITVHSGTLAILTPWAYKQEEVVLKHNNLRRMKKECKHCLIGGAATQIGYTASGNSMDYAYGGAKVKRSFTLEMFEVGQRKKEPESNFAEFLQNKHKTDLGTEQLFCFHYFNPITEKTYNDSIEQWTNIILQLIE